MNVIVKFEVAQATLPPGTTVGELSVWLEDAIGVKVATQTAVDNGATFNDVAPGDYKAKAARLDAAGAVLGIAVEAAFNVPAPVLADVPASITVTLA